MKLEDICVSLELAKELRDAGYPQEDSLFYWVKKATEISVMGKGVMEYAPEAVICAAPTCAEIGDKLPAIITHSEGNHYYLKIEKEHCYDQEEGWYSNYFDDDGWCLIDDNDPFHQIRLVESFCNLWLYLKKEGLLA